MIALYTEQEHFVQDNDGATGLWRDKISEIRTYYSTGIQIIVCMVLTCFLIV